MKDRYEYAGTRPRRPKQTREQKRGLIFLRAKLLTDDEVRSVLVRAAAEARVFAQMKKVATDKAA